MGDVRVSKITGTTMQPGRQENVSALKVGQPIFWELEPNNPYDKNAIHLYADKEHKLDLGYLQKEMAKEIADKGLSVDSIFVKSVGSKKFGNKENYGCNINIVLK